MRTYVYYPAESPNGIYPVENVAPHSCVFHYATCDHNDILRSTRKLFDDQVHHLPERRVFVLEKFGDPKEEGRSFVGRKPFAGEEKEGNFCE